MLLIYRWVFFENLMITYLSKISQTTEELKIPVWTKGTFGGHLESATGQEWLIQTQLIQSST